MIEIDQETKDGLDLALNEATILGLDLDVNGRTVFVTFDPIALLEDGTLPADNRILFAFKKVGRVAASLTPDPNVKSKAIAFPPEHLPEKMNEFKNEQISGWEFIDNGENPFINWKDDMSFDLKLKDAFEKQHTIDLFQNDKFSNKAIDIRIWFDEIEIYDSHSKPVSIEKFISNGKRGWTKLYEEGWQTQSEIREKLILNRN